MYTRREEKGATRVLECVLRYNEPRGDKEKRRDDDDDDDGGEGKTRKRV